MTEFTTWRSLVDGAEISAIPDSAEFYWINDSFGNPWIDEIVDREMTADNLSESTVNDTNTISNGGDFETADVSEFESILDSGFAIEFVIATTNNDDHIWGTIDGTPRIYIGHGSSIVDNSPNSDNGIFFGGRDSNGDFLSVQTEQQINDGSLTEVIINVSATTSANDIDILIDGVSANLVNQRDNDISLSDANLTECAFWGLNEIGDTTNDDSITADIVGWGLHNQTISEGSLI